MIKNIRIKIIFVLLLFLTNYNYGQLVINEFSCSNRDDYADNYGENRDWIELYNGTGTAINLTGYYLSDKLSNPTKWQIPSGSIAAYGYAIAFCDNLDEVSGGFMHTNFKLTQTSFEDVILTNPSAVVIDSYTIVKPTQRNHSTGRLTDGSVIWGYFPNPSPLATNTGAYYDYASKPIFNLSPGFYAGTQAVSISSPDAGVTIRYTTDGQAVTTTSPIYSTPININSTSLIRARCFSSDPLIFGSLTESNTYFINETHTIPVISLGGDFDALFNDYDFEIPSSYEYFDENNLFQFEQFGDMRGHGNDSWAFDQKGIRFYTRDEYGIDDKINYQLFPNRTRTNFDVVIMKAAGSDNYPASTSSAAHIRDGFIQSLAQEDELHVDTRTYRSIAIYINGDYWGIYELRERVDSDYTEYYYGQEEENVDMLEYWGALNVRYGSDTEWNNLYNYMMANDLSVDANYEYVITQLDPLSFIDYFILNTFFVNQDWLNWNTAWWRGTQGAGVRWKYSLWDMDATNGLCYADYTGTGGCDWGTETVCNAMDYFPNDPDIPHTDMYAALLNNQTFFELYVNRYADLLNTTLNCDRTTEHMNQMESVMLPEMPQHVARWGGSVADWQNNIQDIRDFMCDRDELISEQIVTCFEDQISGPYQLTLDVSPALSGTIQLNSINPTDYPWSGTYFGGIDLTLFADPSIGFVFDHWAINSNVLSPDELTQSVLLNLTSDDTLIAYFTPDVQHLITIFVNPPNTGNVDINGIISATYPYTHPYGEGIEIPIESLPNTYYRFSHWELNNNVLSPNDTAAIASILVTQPDSLTAFFEEIIYSITFTWDNSYGSTITINGVTYDGPTITLNIPASQFNEIQFNANDEFNIFDLWTANNNVLLPDFDSENLALYFTSNDTVVAYFTHLTNYELILAIEPPLAGSITLDRETINEFPFAKRVLGNVDIPVKANEDRAFEFVGWRTSSSFTPTKENPRGNINLQKSDSLVAVFKERIEGLYIPNSFTPNGDGVNDIFRAYGSEIDDQNGFEMNIYNRWGEFIYQTFDLEKGWNGEQKIGSDFLSPDEAFVYHVKYKSSITGEIKEIWGFVVLVR
jgi:gliding motility-associated-like protein